MVRLSLHRHVPLLVATGAFAIGCGPALLGQGDTDSEPTSSTTDSPTEPTDPSTPTTPTDPSDPTVNPSVPTTDPTDPTGPIPTDGPPQLIAAQVLDAFVVELFFNEPIAQLGAVDTAKFRLSAAWTAPQYYYGTGTWYSDLGRWNGEEVCMEYCYGDDYGYGESGDNCNEWCYTPAGPDVKVQSVTNHNYYSDRVLLALDQPITANLCKQIRQREEDGADVAAMFLHYSNNGVGITDTDNEQLDAIAEHWVLLSNQDYSYQPEPFPFMNPFVPISCPF